MLGSDVGLLLALGLITWPLVTFLESRYPHYNNVIPHFLRHISCRPNSCRSKCQRVLLSIFRYVTPFRFIKLFVFFAIFLAIYKLSSHSLSIYRLRQLETEAISYAQTQIPPYPKNVNFEGQGIVFAGGGKGYLPLVFANIFLLREVHHCRLPIEIWYVGSEEISPECLRLFTGAFDQVTLRDALSIKNPIDGLTMGHLIRDLNLGPGKYYPLKIFAILSSRFREVFFIDGDSFPLRDPSPLFQNALYLKHGNLFWPDVPPPNNDPAFFRHTNFRTTHDLLETESGQLLIDKQTHWPGLCVAWFLNQRADTLYTFLHGDKDTFDISSNLVNLPFALVSSPYSTVAGYVEAKAPRSVYFNSIIHFDPTDGHPIFAHHVGSANKRRITHGVVQPLWTHAVNYTLEKDVCAPTAPKHNCPRLVFTEPSPYQIPQDSSLRLIPLLQRISPSSSSSSGELYSSIGHHHQAISPLSKSADVKTFMKEVRAGLRSVKDLSVVVQLVSRAMKQTSCYASLAGTDIIRPSPLEAFKAWFFT